MRTNKLRTAAEAAGYAMVNPEDFAAEAPRQAAQSRPIPGPEEKKRTGDGAWFGWQLFWSGGAKPAV